MSERTLSILRQCAPIFVILQDERRQELLERLFQNGELTVNALAEKMTISRTAVSHHLKLLKQTGVIAVRKAGREKYCRLSLAGSVELLRSLLASLEDDQKNIAERNKQT
ncbi:MAG: metalloregulator ArsR/SmtB family transcription factor [Desulfovibrio sp.]|nr:metalloregulator ArsR/SmtB family transcription factor [Desulfovibrio sp.]